MDFRTDILPHRDRLYRLALGITLHTAEAEDVVQDTMMRAWEQRSQWASIQNVEAWLTQICRNLALDRKKRAQHEVTTDTVVTDPASSLSHPASHPSDALDALESLSLLSQLMNQLPPPQDDIVRLREVEGLSYHDIAAALDLSEDQVRVYLHRARQRLREQYTRLQNYGL